MEWNNGANPLLLTSVCKEWEDTDFECPDCKDGIMQRHNGVVLTSLPPKYEYRCKKCGSIHYRYQ